MSPSHSRTSSSATRKRGTDGYYLDRIPVDDLVDAVMLVRALNVGRFLMLRPKTLVTFCNDKDRQR